MHEKVYTPDSTVVTSLPGEVVEWSLDRDLSGAGVPGQARAVSGLVSAGGSVTLKSLAGEAWKPTVLPGGTVTVDAKADIDSPASRVFTGKAASLAAASALSPVLSLEIKDNTPRGKKFTWTSPPRDDRTSYADVINDTAGFIDAAARACGFFATPKAVSSTILAVSFQGNTTPHVGYRSGPRIA